MDTPRVHPHDHDDDTLEAHYACLERPCACIDGYVYIGHMVEEEGVEVEMLEPVPCQRCAAASR